MGTNSVPDPGFLPASHGPALSRGLLGRGPSPHPPCGAVLYQIDLAIGPGGHLPAILRVTCLRALRLIMSTVTLSLLITLTKARGQALLETGALLPLRLRRGAGYRPQNRRARNTYADK